MIINCIRSWSLVSVVLGYFPSMLTLTPAFAPAPAPAPAIALDGSIAQTRPLADCHSSILSSFSPQHETPTMTRVILLASHVCGTHEPSVAESQSISPKVKEWGTGSVSCTTTLSQRTAYRSAFALSEARFIITFVLWRLSQWAVFPCQASPPPEHVALT
ncbi:hypothetical protein B0O80DRAFT_195039 [Mortierella sp. GBAus27b]|nr:hypothetical protein B0O80DRAFT_195039 [Mortierella sp. GBAus27b]